VSKYQEFEKLLHEKFKPFTGTNRVGKKSAIIYIEN